MARGKKNEKELTIEERLKKALVPVEEQPYSVPENWCWTMIEYVATVITGGTPSKKISEYYGTYFPFFKPADLDAGRYVFESSEYLSEKGKNVSRIIPAHSTAVCCIGSIGKSGYLMVEGTTNQQINSAIPLFDPLYLFYYSNTDCFVNQLLTKASATTIAIVNKSKMEQCFFPLAPLAEQQRIVDRIESLFAKLDEAKEKAQVVVDGFETRKSAILHKAFTGELTAQWRERCTTKMNPWGRKRIINFATVVSGYAFNSKDFSEKNTIPCVKITNVGVGNYCEEEHEYLPQEFINRYSKFIVRENDLLISLTRSYISNGLKVCIYPFNKSALLNQRVALVRECNIPYLYYYFCTDEALNYVKDKSRTTNQPNLSIKDLCNLKVPFPSPDEQAEIVRILDTLLAKEQQAKEAAEAVLYQIETMKKSILARAFRGELGTNDPAEESAVELLKQVL